MSPLLQEFYNSIAEWVRTGESNFEFIPSVGLCTNLYIFCANNGVEAVDPLVELKIQFRCARLDDEFPFNPTPGRYIAEADAAACYDNAERVKWIMDREKK